MCVLTKVILVRRKVRIVISLSSWKYSFEIVNRELELTRKKREALDDLFNKYDSILNDIDGDGIILKNSGID